MPLRQLRDPVLCGDCFADLLVPLRRVGEEATRVAGQPADEVTLTVPAGWGPARRTVLRRAATRAGLPQPHLIDTPIAVSNHLTAAGIAIPAGTALLVCDVGAGRLEATVLTRTSGGFEVHSTVDTADAAGLVLDAALADHVATLAAALTAPPTDAPPTDALGNLVTYRAQLFRQTRRRLLLHQRELRLLMDRRIQPHERWIIILNNLLHVAIAGGGQATSGLAAAVQLVPVFLAGGLLYLWRELVPARWWLAGIAAAGD